MSIEAITTEIKEEIAKLTQALRVLEGIGGKRAKIKRATAPRRKMSAAGRRRIAAAQRARWARVKAGRK